MSSTKRDLAGKVCIVTGATRGIGKGIALQLANAGAIVYFTGRTLSAKPNDPVGGSLTDTAAEIAARGGTCIPVQCDHTKDEDIECLFERVKKEQDGRLDILVNNAYSAVNAIADNIGKPFWEQDMNVWDKVNNVGLRNHYMCSIHAAKMMVPRKQGLIVNISSFGGLVYLFNVPYGVGKEACDRMAADCAHELRKENVTFVSLWPGAVKTETVMHLYGQNTLGAKVGNIDVKNIIENGESTEYAGKAIVHLAKDPDIMKKSGRILMTADLGYEYGFKDIDGREIPRMRSLQSLVRLIPSASWLGKWIPRFITIPKWVVALSGNKF